MFLIKNFVYLGFIIFTSCNSSINTEPESLLKNDTTLRVASNYKQNPNSKKLTQADSIMLVTVYSQAISDYIQIAYNKKLLQSDTLFFGKRNNALPDDFPDIDLPEQFNKIHIRLIEPSIGEKLQRENPARIYINLLGWVEKLDAQFIFVTFSNGFDHQFDYHVEYSYDTENNKFNITKSSIERF